MKKLLYIAVFLSLTFIPIKIYSSEIVDYERIKNKPADYIEVHDWNFYVASRVAILYNVTLENKSPVTYKRVKVRVNYFSRSGPSVGQKISEQRAVLDITLPPNSKQTYLKGGYPIGAGSPSFKVKDLDIISADVVKN